MIRWGWHRIVFIVVAAFAFSVVTHGFNAAAAITGTVWKPIGPSPISEPRCSTCNPGAAFEANGRVNSIAVDPTNSNVIYLGSAGGGVLRSDNGGSNWTPLNDTDASLG